MKKRSFRAMSTLGTVAATALLSVPAAEASSDALSDCLENRICLYANAFGTPFLNTVGDPLRCIDTRVALTAYNHKGPDNNFRVWQNSNCTGNSARVWGGNVFQPQGWTIDAMSP